MNAMSMTLFICVCSIVLVSSFLLCCFPYCLFMPVFVSLFVSLSFFSFRNLSRIFIFHPTCRGHMGKRSAADDVTAIGPHVRTDDVTRMS